MAKGEGGRGGGEEGRRGAVYIALAVLTGAQNCYTGSDVMLE